MSDAAKYIRRVRSCLPGTRKQTAWICEQVRGNLDTDISQLSYAEIVDRLGTPESLAAEQIESMPPMEIAEKMRLQNWIKKVVLAIAATIIILLTGLVVAEYVDARKDVQGYIEAGEAVIISESEDQVGNKNAQKINRFHMYPLFSGILSRLQQDSKSNRVRL